MSFFNANGNNVYKKEKHSYCTPTDKYNYILNIYSYQAYKVKNEKPPKYKYANIIKKKCFKLGSNIIF